MCTCARGLSPCWLSTPRQGRPGRDPGRDPGRAGTGSPVARRHRWQRQRGRPCLPPLPPRAARCSSWARRATGPTHLHTPPQPRRPTKTGRGDSPALAVFRASPRRDVLRGEESAHASGIAGSLSQDPHQAGEPGVFADRHLRPVPSPPRPASARLRSRKRARTALSLRLRRGGVGSAAPASRMFAVVLPAPFLRCASTARRRTRPGPPSHTAYSSASTVPPSTAPLAST